MNNKSIHEQKFIDIVDMIDAAPREAIDAAIQECSIKAHNPFGSKSMRPIWFDMARLLRRQRRRF